LKYSRERYWKELRVALPMNVGLSRFDERADLTQVGVVALSLIIGRPFRDEEYPRQLEELLAGAQARDINGLAPGIAVNTARVAEGARCRSTRAPRSERCLTPSRLWIRC
jgi:hypothetical protein